MLKITCFCNFSLSRFEPPVIPKDFVAHHKFSAPLEIESKLTDTPPPEVPPPEDKSLKVMIEAFATLVARSGKLFEDVAREKSKSNPLFSFINKGNGCDYYLWKLWEEKQKHSNNQTRHKLERNSFPQPQGEKMTAESRGKILGEKPLERSSTNLNSSVASADGVQLQFKLSDTFTEPTKFVSVFFFFPCMCVCVCLCLCLPACVCVHVWISVYVAVQDSYQSISVTFNGQVHLVVLLY